MDLLLKFIALLSLPISLVAAIIANGSRKIAKKALEINESSYYDRQSNFEMYFMGGNYFNDTANHRRIILLQVTIHNRSDTKNSFISSLEFEYSLPSGEERKIIVDHDPNLASIVNNMQLISFGLNPRLDEKHSDSKWLFFAEPSNLPADYRNSKYKVFLKDNKGVTSSQEIYILTSIQ